MGLFDIQKKNATELAPVPKQDVMQPVPQDDGRSAAAVKLELAQGGVELVKTLIDGGIDIAKIQAAGTQKVNEIKAEIGKMLAESQIRMDEEGNKARIWHEKFDRRKNAYFDAVAQISAMEATSEEKQLWIEILKEVLKNET